MSADELEELRAAVRASPDDEDLRWELLFAYCGKVELHADPDRLEQIVWHVRNVPRASTAQCPCAHVSPAISREGFAMIEREWLLAQELAPDDSGVARGLAAFVAGDDRARAVKILRPYVVANPDDAEVWLEMGRISPDHVEGLRFLQEARARGVDHPNLLVWLAFAAVAANDLSLAAVFGEELLDRAMAGDNERQRSYDKHHGNIALGIVAFRAGDADAAIRYLMKSAAVSRDYRLSSYGPWLRLAQELCGAGYFVEVAAFLRACQAFWEADLDEWFEDLANGRVPDFDGER